jgi:hypothetical protein
VVLGVATVRGALGVGARGDGRDDLGVLALAESDHIGDFDDPRADQDFEECFAAERLRRGG